MLETDFVASTVIEGSSVYGADGRKVGYIKRLMLNKRSGQIEHVVVTSGGAILAGGTQRRLPWSKLKYNSELRGYEVYH